MDLPSAPLTPVASPPPASPPPPLWTGFPSAAPAVSQPSTLNAQLPRPLITREQLTTHLTLPTAWRSLPDGRPLRLQAEGMEYIIDDFGGFDPAELRSAHRVLYFATRTEAEMRALWIPPLPRGEDATPQEGIALHVRALQADIGAWASATFAPDTYTEVRRLALMLWSNVVARMPVSAEKKNPQPQTTGTPEISNPTSATSAGSSPAETLPDTSNSASAPMSALSSQPSSDGPTGTDAGSSPCRKNPEDSPPPAS